MQDLKAFLCVIPLLSRMRGNAIPGAPVKASMSDGYAVTRVEPWNAFCIPPLIHSGVGIFYTHPNGRVMNRE